MTVPAVDGQVLELAVEVAQRAGQVAARHFFAASFSTSTKADGTEVSEADLAVEELIRGELLRTGGSLSRARVQLVNPGTWPGDLLMALYQNVTITGYLGGVAGVLAALLDAAVVAGFPQGYEDLSHRCVPSSVRRSAASLRMSCRT